VYSLIPNLLTVNAVGRLSLGADVSVFSEASSGSRFQLPISLLDPRNVRLYRQ